jgi:16S rRNA (cytosine967-C5)-methyltransferase
VREAPGLPARAAALKLLSTILDRRRPLEDAIEEPALAGALDALEARDRGFALALVRTTLRRLGQIDAALASLIDEPLPARAGPAMHILRLAAADLVFLETPPHAAVDCAVELAGADKSARHFRGLVNAVLRRVSERAAAVREEDPAQTLLPDWLRQGWVRAYGESQADEIIRAHVHEPAIDLTLKPDLDAHEWAQRLGARALPTGSLRLGDHPRLTELAGYSEGAWWVQDAAAALPARLLGDVRGLRVLDLCAAPGGKTAHLAAHGARVVAVEKLETRAVRLRENLARLRLEAELIVADARDFIDREAFDAVLLDAPCTATGTIRRHPDIPWIKEADDVRALSLIQDELLAAAVACLRPGGRLVYSVCSLEPEEGEEVIARFLAAQPAAARVPARPEELTGAEEFVTGEGDLRTTPADWPQWGGLDGFYAARLTRV